VWQFTLGRFKTLLFNFWFRVTKFCESKTEESCVLLWWFEWYFLTFHITGDYCVKIFLQVYQIYLYLFGSSRVDRRLARDQLSCIQETSTVKEELCVHMFTYPPTNVIHILPEKTNFKYTVPDQKGYTVSRSQLSVLFTRLCIHSQQNTRKIIITCPCWPKKCPHAWNTSFICNDFVCGVPQ